MMDKEVLGNMHSGTYHNLRFPRRYLTKYLGIIIRSDLNWAEQVDYTDQKASRALHFVMCIVKKGK
jgi:hypothetical protein